MIEDEKDRAKKEALEKERKQLEERKKKNKKLKMILISTMIFSKRKK